MPWPISPSGEPIIVPEHVFLPARHVQPGMIALWWTNDREGRFHPTAQGERVAASKFVGKRRHRLTLGSTGHHFVHPHDPIPVLTSGGEVLRIPSGGVTIEVDAIDVTVDADA